MTVRPLEKGLLLDEIGEGWLALSGDGQGLEPLVDDPVAKRNRPSFSAHRIDTAHLSRMKGTDFVQWYGRKSDGRFHPLGRIMHLTKAGKKAIKP